MIKNEITIKTEFIKLDQLLKFANLVGSGSEAKDIIWSGMVSVNDEKCELRGKKIRSGDVVKIEFDDQTVELTVN